MTTRVAGALFVLIAGCLARNAAEPRFFRPDSALLRDTDTGDPSAPPRSARIRIRAVEGEPFVRERVVWRASPVEYGFYEQRRWHDLPASYVDRALRVAFRRAARVHLTDDVRAPSLHVTITAFEEVLSPSHVALVEAMATLRDAHDEVLLERSFRADIPIAGDDPATMATAMGGALDVVVTGIADAVAEAIR